MSFLVANPVGDILHGTLLVPFMIQVLLLMPFMIQVLSLMSFMLACPIDEERYGVG